MSLNKEFIGVLHQYSFEKCDATSVVDVSTLLSAVPPRTHGGTQIQGIRRDGPTAQIL